MNETLDFQQTILSNGLRIITVKRPHTMTAAIRVYVRAGSRYDKERLGVAHFVEHLLFGGTFKRTSKEIYAQIENVGGVIEAGTTREYSTFYVVLMNKYLHIGIDVLADIVMNPAFDRKAYLQEKLIILEEIQRAQDRSSLIWGAFLETLWQKTALKNPILGEAQSLKDIEYDDLMEFYQRHYVSKNMVISVCGDIEHKDVISYLSKKFLALFRGEEQLTLKEKRRGKDVEPKLSAIRKRHIEKDIHQTHMIIGAPAVSMRDKAKDRYAIKLMDKVLGTGGSSRLFQNLRERQALVYSIYSQAPMFEDKGYFAVYAACKPENLNRVENSILDEWQRLGSEPIMDEELRRAKMSYEGTIAREFETNLSIASIFGIEALLHRIEPFKECLQKANSTTKEDIMKAANKYLQPDKYAMVAVGRKLEE